MGSKVFNPVLPKKWNGKIILLALFLSAVVLEVFLIAGARKNIVVAAIASAPADPGCEICSNKDYFHTKLEAKTPLICQSFWHWRYNWEDCLSNATSFRILLRDRLCELCQLPAPVAPIVRQQGVVYTGTEGHMKLIQTSIKMLRHLKFQGRIEVFVSEQNAMKKCQSQIAKLNVQCKLFDTSFRVGFSYKIGAILQSSFDDILFIDADNIVVISPEELFQDTNYLREGALLWADYWGYQCRQHPWNVADDNPEGVMLCGQTAWPDHVAWPVVDMVWQPSRTFSQEITSSQLVIDKVRHRDALELALFMTESRFMQNVLYGDKDTFRLGLLMKKKGIHLVSEMPGQISRDGSRLFVMSWFNGRPMTIDQVKGALDAQTEYEVLVPSLNDFCYSTETESYCAPDYSTTPAEHFLTNASVTNLMLNHLRIIAKLQ